MFESITDDKIDMTAASTFIVSKLLSQLPFSSSSVSVFVFHTFGVASELFCFLPCIYITMIIEQAVIKDSMSAFDKFGYIVYHYWHIFLSGFSVLHGYH